MNVALALVFAASLGGAPEKSWAVRVSESVMREHAAIYNKWDLPPLASCLSRSNVSA